MGVNGLEKNIINRENQENIINQQLELDFSGLVGGCIDDEIKYLQETKCKIHHIDPYDFYIKELSTVDDKRSLSIVIYNTDNNYLFSFNISTDLNGLNSEVGHIEIIGSNMSSPAAKFESEKIKFLINGQKEELIKKGFNKRGLNTLLSKPSQIKKSKLGEPITTESVGRITNGPNIFYLQYPGNIEKSTASLHFRVGTEVYRVSQIKYIYTKPDGRLNEKEGNIGILNKEELRFKKYDSKEETWINSENSEFNTMLYYICQKVLKDYRDN